MRVFSLTALAFVLGLSGLAATAPAVDRQDALQNCESHADAWKIQAVLRLHEKMTQRSLPPSAEASISADIERAYVRQLAFCSAAV